MKRMRPSSPGTSTVLTMNHRERMRSMNSRWATIQSLRIDASHRLPVRLGGRHAIHEHAVQRRLDELESLHDRSGVDEGAEQPLRVRVGREVDVDRLVGIVHALYERTVL